MKKILLALYLLLIPFNAHASQPYSKLEPYTETTKGKTTVCGINFYIFTDTVKDKAISGYYGSVFVMINPKGYLVTAMRVNEFQSIDQLIPIDWANLKLRDTEGKPFDTSKFMHVENPDDPKGYSAITRDPNAGNILAYLAFGGTLQVKTADGPSDDNVPFSPIVDAGEYFMKIGKCLVELKR